MELISYGKKNNTRYNFCRSTMGGLNYKNANSLDLSLLNNNHNNYDLIYIVKANIKLCKIYGN